MKDTARMVGDGKKERPALLRRHTEEAPPTAREIYGGSERRVVRAASDDTWAAGRGVDGLTQRDPRHTTSHHQLSSLSPTTALVVRARRLAWSGSSGPVPQAAATPDAAKPVRRRMQVRYKSCVTPLLSFAPSSEETGPPHCEKILSSRSKKPEEDTAPLTNINVEPNPEDQMCPGDDIKTNSTRVTRSASSPNIYYSDTHKKPACINNTHHAQRVKQDLKPYDGLIIQKTPLLCPTAREALVPREADDEADEEDNTSETKEDLKLRGYKPRNGSGFIPFRKLFTKPKKSPLTRRPSRSSLEEPDLGVENTYQKYNDSERDIINKTRSNLKQRLNSASKKKVSGDNKKKIQLSIVVSAGSESDGSARMSDREDSQLTQPPHSANGTTKKQKTKKQRNKDHETPQTRSSQTLRKKEPSAKTGNKTPTNTVRKVKKKELSTVMSEISPIPSDLEFDALTDQQQRPLADVNRLLSAPGTPNRSVRYHQQHNEGVTHVHERQNKSLEHDSLLVQTRGGLLRTIINDASTYTPVSRPGKGKIVHLEVRIQTDKAVSSAEDDEVDDNESQDRRGQVERRSRTQRQARSKGKTHWQRRRPVKERGMNHQPSQWHQSTTITVT
ncbi:uncharacterized protein [Panulirus ornatus]|uniref:uncharacterized protein n=1 Tax=Panulirus ornatus TaxID=150431 RepID=UPI003A836C85